MIDSALSHITGELNDFLKRELDSNTDLVVLSDPAPRDATNAAPIDDRLHLFLVNVTEDPAAPGRGRGIRDGRVSPPTPAPLALTVHVMLAASFRGERYATGLALLSDAIGFFRDRPVLSGANDPGLDDTIEQLTLALEPLSLAELSSLWGVLGGRYLPSVLYRVRLVVRSSATPVDPA